MFNFAKKNVEIEEQVLEDVTDEQLSQVTGGGASFRSTIHSALHTSSASVTGSASTTGTSANASVSAHAGGTASPVAASLTGTLGLSL